MERCNCEASCCNHTQDGHGCTNAVGQWLMDYVGGVCDACADRITRGGGGQYLHDRQRADDDQRRADEGDEQRDYAEERFNAALLREV